MGASAIASTSPRIAAPARVNANAHVGVSWSRRSTTQGQGQPGPGSGLSPTHTQGHTTAIYEDKVSTQRANAMIAAYIRRASTIKGATVAARDWDQGQERTQTRRLPE